MKSDNLEWSEYRRGGGELTGDEPIPESQFVPNSANNKALE